MYVPYNESIQLPKNMPWLSSRYRKLPRVTFGDQYDELNT